MLVMPDLKQIVKEYKSTIDKQAYQIKKLQEDLHTMWLRLERVNGKTSNPE